jgi:hypothetical protein
VIRLVSLLVLCGVLTGLGQDRLGATSYARGLEQESIRGRVIATTDGDTIKVLTADNRRFANRRVLMLINDRESRYRYSGCNSLYQIPRRTHRALGLM